MKRLKAIVAICVSLLFLVSLNRVLSISIGQGKDDENDKGTAGVAVADGIAAEAANRVLR